MVVGIGIDLVNIPQFEKNLQNDAFVRKVFTPAERLLCEEVKNSSEHFAGKFAAKEALMKAIGKGIRQEVWFSQIAVLNRDTGAPYIEVAGEAKSTLDSLSVDSIQVSISHTQEMAVAIVILEANS